MEIFGFLKTSKIMAILSFCFGTLIFLLHYLIPEQSQVVIIGLCYVILAGVVNFIMLLILIGIAFIRMDAIEDIAKSILMLIVNIPISVIYFMLVINY
jgi:hypothetical protein